ncbi:MAG: TraR/DksA family transcriptional regulator [Actinomycetota bacterium]|nr:TraR/DksA family transcriptional regulator [Actinomycetota bacterium]
MDDQRARTLLDAERQRLEALIDGAEDDARSDRDEENAPGDLSDPAERLTAEGTDDALAAGLRVRLEALQRAEERLAAGTYGKSVRSGQPIPEERLEADPAAELTVEEAADDGQALG